MEIIDTARQQEFLEMMKTGRNLFLTGKAGTGKSYIIKKAMKEMTDAGIPFIAIAPTGIAAINVNGSTIHSAFRVSPHGVASFETAQFMSDAKRKVIKKAKVFFIDEVSMMTADLLDAINWSMVKNGLGSITKKQIIFVGDMKQLPPVLKDNKRSVLLERYDGFTFQFAKIFPALNVHTIELDEVVRQSDPDFIHALNFIRDGKKSEYFRQFKATEPKGIILAPHNSTVKAYNEAGYAAQAGEPFFFQAEVDGEAKPEDFNVEREIYVKNGCKIMYLVNSQDSPLRNGTLGIFVSHKGCHFIRVGNVDHSIEPFMFTKKEYVYDEKSDSLKLRELGTITQMPIKLAYALSIHKSQGLTFDEVTVDLRQPCFENGQMYVALSRVTGPGGLRILTP